MVLLIKGSDIEPILTVSEALKAVEKCFVEYSSGKVQMPERIVLSPREGWIGVMSAYMETEGALATKIVASYPENFRFGYSNIIGIVIYNEPSTGIPLAIMDAGCLTAIRTGAASGVATLHLARTNSENLAILGSGTQAKTQLEAINEVRKLKKVKVYSPNPQHRKSFAREMGKKLGLNVIPVDDAENAVRNSDIVVTATSSKTPVLNGDWLMEGVHINAIGAHTPDTRELDDETIKKSKIVVDSREAALKEAGDIIIPLNQKLVSKDSIYAEIGEIILGKKKGRTSQKEVTLFKSVGLAVQDVAVAKIVYEKAKKLGLGKEVELS